MAELTTQCCSNSGAKVVVAKPVYLLMKVSVLLQEVEDGAEEKRDKEREFTSAKEGIIIMPHVSLAEVERYLKGINYPVSKRGLIAHAQHQGAKPEIIEVLKYLPEERFNTLIEVNKAIGEVESR